MPYVAGLAIGAIAVLSYESWTTSRERQGLIDAEESAAPSDSAGRAAAKPTNLAVPGPPGAPPSVAADPFPGVPSSSQERARAAPSARIATVHAPDLALAGGADETNAPAVDPGDDPPGPPVPILPVVEQGLKNFAQAVPGSSAKGLLARHEQIEREPEDDWSRAMEAALRQFVASQPEADGLQPQIACRVTQCELQLFDVKSPVPPERRARSSVVIARLLSHPIMRSLHLGPLHSGVYKNQSYSLLFLERPSQL
jgi:hypothetical protein